MKEGINEVIAISTKLNFVSNLKDLEARYKSLNNQELSLEQKQSKYAELDKLFEVELKGLVDAIKIQGIGKAKMLDAIQDDPALSKAFASEGLSSSCKAKYPEISAGIYAHGFLQSLAQHADSHEAIELFALKVQSTLSSDLNPSANDIKIMKHGLSIVYSKLSDEQIEHLAKEFKDNIGEFSAKGLALNDQIIKMAKSQNPKLVLMGLELKKQYIDEFSDFLNKFALPRHHDERGKNYDEDDGHDFTQVKDDALDLFAPLITDKKSLQAIGADIAKMLDGLSQADPNSARQALAIELGMKFKELKPALKSEFLIDIVLQRQDSLGDLNRLLADYSNMLANQNRLFFKDAQQQDLQGQELENAKAAFNTAVHAFEEKIGGNLQNILKESSDSGIEVFQLAARMMTREDGALLFQNDLYSSVLKEQAPELLANINAYNILSAGDSSSVLEALKEHLRDNSLALEEGFPVDHSSLSIVYSHLEDRQIDDLSKYLQDEVRNGEVANKFLAFNNSSIDGVNHKSNELSLMQLQLAQAYSEVLPNLLFELVNRDEHNDVNFGIVKPYLAIPLEDNNLQEVINYAIELFAPLEKRPEKLEIIKADIKKTLEEKALGQDDSKETRESLGLLLKKISKKHNAMDLAYAGMEPRQIEELSAKFQQGIDEGRLSCKFAAGFKSALKKIPRKSPELVSMQSDVARVYKDKLPNLLTRIIEEDLAIPLQKDNLAKVKSKVRNLFIPVTSNKAQLDRMANTVEEIIVTEAKESLKHNGVERDIKRGMIAKITRFCSKQFASLKSVVSSRARSDGQIIPTTTRALLQECAKETFLRA
jgi:hypothetical protein